MNKLVNIKSPQICLEGIPRQEMNDFVRATLHAVEKYFEIPENKARYEKWLAERNAAKTAK